MVLRIGIIDDNAMILDALIFVLRDKGHETSVADNAFNGLSMIENTPLDAVIVDLNLPGMKGDALVREIRSRHPDLAIVLTSGGSTAPEGSIGEDGADAFLPKPFTPKVLLACIADVTASRGAQ
jgi:DNA-binding response OmpR family regulator